MFNLSPEKANERRQTDVYCLIIYDIESNKRRIKLVKILEGFGKRVQKSCFEIKLSKSQFRQMKKEIKAFYDRNEMDNIIIYRISEEKVYRYNEEVIQFHGDLLYF